MDDFEFIDALTGDKIICTYRSGDVFLEKGPHENSSPTKIFFPGCSMINYAMPLVDAVYKTLLQHDRVDGISLLCCGKILSYEPDGDIIRESFEEQLRSHVHNAGITTIICACPNCVRALCEAFALDERTKDVKIEVLPQVLADLGYVLDEQTVAELIKGDASAKTLLCTHDSCPDREYGRFADGLRVLLPEGLWVDPEHCRKRSVCCGSLPRAAGKTQQADQCADLNGREALEVHADAIVTSCMSCAFQLNMAQPHVQAVHILELLYGWRIDWTTVGAWMKLRFLFDETLGVTMKETESGRTFAGLTSAEGDAIAKEDVALSEDNVEELGL